ncbi:MAG: hypothetical protein LBP35_04550 [Candidatus Ancillula trichonymphae]|nr:hypothetical protein [Candidatus Ancillula trichonymphae]
MYMGTDARLHEYLLGSFAALVVLWQSKNPPRIVHALSRLSINIKKLLLSIVTLSAAFIWMLMIALTEDYHAAYLYNGGFVFISVALTIPCSFAVAQG